MWVGVTTHKNSLGLLCIIASFFLIWSLVRTLKGSDIPVCKYRIYADVFILIITLGLLNGPLESSKAYSATAIGALIMGLFFFVGLLWMKKRRINLRANTLVAIMALIIGYGIVTPMLGGATVAGFTSGFGRTTTLTGRTEIWRDIINYAVQRPILGYGFGGFWTSKTNEVIMTNEAHNGYLSVWVELGFMGLLLLLLFLLSCVRKARQEMAHNFDWGVLWFCFLVMVIIHNITEATIDSFSRQSTAVILFLAFSNKRDDPYNRRIS